VSGPVTFRTGHTGYIFCLAFGRRCGCRGKKFGHPSSRPFRGLPELTYPLHDRDVVVTARGRLCLHRKKINISTVLAGQRLGIKEVDAAFGSSASRTMASRLVRPGAKSPAAPRQPLRPKVVTHGLGTFCYLCLQAGHDFVGAARGIRTPGPIITNDAMSRNSC